MMHLDDMAKDERKDRVLPNIVKFIKSKRWITSQSAMDEFGRITDIIAGDAEKERAERLKRRIEIVDNCMSERIEHLPESARISLRAKLSFGTGEVNKAVTVSSNTGFIRAARQQGVYVSVLDHRPRALSENKEKLAVTLHEELNEDFKIDYFEQLFA